MPPLRALARRVLARCGYAVLNTRRHYAEDGLFTLHNQSFRRDPRFRAAYARGVRASLGALDGGLEWRVHVALWAASTALRVEGDFVECGVNAGVVSSAVMNYLNFSSLARKYYLIDTFSGPVIEQFSDGETRDGLPDRARRLLDAGAYVTDVTRVRENFAEWPNAVVVQGAVPAALDAVRSEHVAFLHLDMNCAMPERAALEALWPRIPRGGVVLLDDYAYWGHGNQKDAMDAAARSLGVEVLSLPTGQGLIVA
jgi:hypothetical protein